MHRTTWKRRPDGDPDGGTQWQDALAPKPIFAYSGVHPLCTELVRALPRLSGALSAPDAVISLRRVTIPVGDVVCHCRFIIRIRSVVWVAGRSAKGGMGNDGLWMVAFAQRGIKGEAPRNSEEQRTRAPNTSYTRDSSCAFFCDLNSLFSSSQCSAPRVCTLTGVHTEISQRKELTPASPPPRTGGFHPQQGVTDN